MARKRMFSRVVTETDAFRDLPVSARCLYYDLAMYADDYGFVGNPKMIIKLCGASEDDLKILIAKQFVLVFESGVVLIRHWLVHNTIRKDRSTESFYLEEAREIFIAKNKIYNRGSCNDGEPLVAKMTTQSKKEKKITEKEIVDDLNGEEWEKLTLDQRIDILEHIKNGKE